MNISTLITQLRSKKAYLWVDKTDLVIKVPPEVMTPKIIADIREHKLEIIDYLNSANEEIPKKYAYRFELKNNAGGGTWITDKAPNEAKKDLDVFYIAKEIQLFELIN